MSQDDEAFDGGDFDDGDFDDGDFDEETRDAIAGALAEKLGVGLDTIWVEPCDLDIPGVVLFGASGPVGRRSWAGSFDGTRIDLDPDRAMTAVFRAWGYGPRRTCPARDVAAAAGLLEGQPGSPFLEEDEIEEPDRRAGVTVPVEVDVDGMPGVAYWNRSSRRRLWSSLVVAGPDGRATWVGRG